MGLLTTEISNRKHLVQNAITYQENTTLPIIEPIEEGPFYILVPLVAFLAVVLLSLLVYLMASNRRQLVHIYCKKQNSRRFMYDDNEYDSTVVQYPEASEEEDDEFGTEDNPAKSLLRGTLQINNCYENYLSTSQLKRSSELFT